MIECFPGICKPESGITWPAQWQQSGKNEILSFWKSIFDCKSNVLHNQINSFTFDSSQEPTPDKPARSMASEESTNTPGCKVSSQILQFSWAIYIKNSYSWLCDQEFFSGSPLWRIFFPSLFWKNWLAKPHNQWWKLQDWILRGWVGLSSLQKHYQTDPKPPANDTSRGNPRLGDCWRLLQKNCCFEEERNFQEGRFQEGQ